MAGYTRNDTSNNIATGNIINASDLDGEFDAIQTAFDATTGHNHDGTVGEGVAITVTGPAQDFVSSSTDFRPKADNTYDLGTAANEWKDLYVDGIGYIDTLTADAGTVAGAAITTISNTQTLTGKTINLTDNTLVATSAQLAAALTDETGTGSVVFSASPALTGTPTAPTAAAATNTTQIATTAHVFAERTNSATLTNKTLTSPVIGTPTITTPVISSAALGTNAGDEVVVGTFSTLDLTNAITLRVKNRRHTTGSGWQNTETRVSHDVDGNTDKNSWMSFFNKSATLTDNVIRFGEGANTEWMRIDNGNVGIGTAIPATALDVNGDITIADKIIHSGDTNTAIRFPEADVVSFETGGVERLRVTAAGNIGVGVTNPAFRVQAVLSSATDNKSLGITETDYLANFRATYLQHFGLSATGTTYGISNANLGVLHFQNTSAGVIGTNGAAPIIFATTALERMRILANGNVGIGTTTPAEKLDVNGNIKVGDGATLYSNTNITISADPGNTGASSVINMLVDNLEVADFNSAGYLRFNKAAFAGAGICTQQSDNVLNIGGGQNTVNDGVNFSLSGPTHVSGVAGFQFRDGTTTKHRWDRASDAFLWNTGGSERFRIASTGNVGIGATVPNTQLHLYGTGQETADLTDAGARGAMIRLSGIGSNAGTGGAILFANQQSETANSVGFAAIKGLLTSGANNTTGAIAFSTRNVGTDIALTERMRILANGNVGIGTATPVTTLDVNGAVISRGIVYRNQPTQTSKAAAATLTIAELLTGIVQYTGAADTLTLPTGTLIEGGVPATFPTDMSFDFSVINTGSGAVALGTATGLTLTGSMSVAAGASGMFRVRKTATNTYTIYRIS